MVTVLLSHASDGDVRAIWPRHDVHAESCWCFGCGTMLMSSHAADGAAKSCW
jgi:hypothetical protein